MAGEFSKAEEDFHHHTTMGSEANEIAIAILAHANAIDRLAEAQGKTAEAIEGVEHVIGLICNEGGRSGPQGALVGAIRDASVSETEA